MLLVLVLVCGMAAGCQMVPVLTQAPQTARQPAMIAPPPTATTTAPPLPLFQVQLRGQALGDWRAGPASVVALWSDPSSPMPGALFVNTFTTPDSPRADQGAHLLLPASLSEALTGRPVRITVTARRPPFGGSDQFAVAYTRGDGSGSGWIQFQPGTAYRSFSFDLALSPGVSDGDIVGIWADSAGTGRGILLRDIEVRALGAPGSGVAGVGGAITVDPRGLPVAFIGSVIAAESPAQTDGARPSRPPPTVQDPAPLTRPRAGALPGTVPAPGFGGTRLPSAAEELRPQLPQAADEIDPQPIEPVPPDPLPPARVPVPIIPPPPPPEPEPSPDRPFGAHIASYSTADLAEQGFRTLAARFPVLAPFEPLVLPGEQSDGNTVQRLLIGPFTTRLAVETFCAEALFSWSYCEPTPLESLPVPDDDAGSGGSTAG